MLFNYKTRAVYETKKYSVYTAMFNLHCLLYARIFTETFNFLQYVWLVSSCRKCVALNHERSVKGVLPLATPLS